MPLLTSLFSTTWRGQVAPRGSGDRAFDCEAHTHYIVLHYTVDSKGLSISSGLPTWIVSPEASQGVSEISRETDWIETMSKVKIDFPTSGLVVVKDGDSIVVFAKTPLSVGDPKDVFPYVAQAYRVVADRYQPTLSLIPVSEPVRVSAFDVAQHGLD